MSTLVEPKTNPVRRITHATPAATIRATADGWTLELEMPGVPKDGVEITCHDDTLTVTGNRCPAPVDSDATCAAASAWRRAFLLDPAIDTESITASMEQGLLTLVLPKAETAKPRKVSVT